MRSQRLLRMLWCLLPLVCFWIAAQADPCSCDELTVSGAGDTRINGTYTHEPFITTQEWFEGTEMWIGPAYSIASIHGNWAVLHFEDSTWFAGLFVVYSGGEHVIYVIDHWYQNSSTKRCPPKNGWTSSGGGAAPTIARDGCLCLGIGDLDADGAVTMIDARLCLQIVTDVIPGTPEQRAAADVDEDGDVDHDDVDLLAEQLIGLCP